MYFHDCYVCFTALPRVLHSPPQLCCWGASSPGALCEGWHETPTNTGAGSPTMAKARRNHMHRPPHAWRHGWLWQGTGDGELGGLVRWEYGLGDRTCSAGLQARCHGKAAVFRRCTVTPSWGCQPWAPQLSWQHTRFFWFSPARLGEELPLSRPYWDKYSCWQQKTQRRPSVGTGVGLGHGVRVAPGSFPQEVASAGRSTAGHCCHYTSFLQGLCSRHCCLPLCSCGGGLWGSPGQPCIAPHGMGAPSSGSRGLLWLSTGACGRHLQRSLQAQPCASKLLAVQPELSVQAGGCAKACVCPCRPRNMGVASPTEQVLPNKDCAGDAGQGQVKEGNVK